MKSISFRQSLFFPGKCGPLRGKGILLDFSKLYLEICAGMTLMQMIAFLPVDFVNCDFFFFLKHETRGWVYCDI